MRVTEMAKLIKAEIVTIKFEDKEVTNAYTSDLLSDVMGNAEEGSVLITIQAHKNTVAVASQLDLSAILICNGRTIPEDMIKSAEAEGIPVLKTRENQFQSSVSINKAIFA